MKRAKAERAARLRRDEVKEEHQAIARVALDKKAAIKAELDDRRAQYQAIETMLQTIIKEKKITEDQLRAAMAHVEARDEQNEMKG